VEGDAAVLEEPEYGNRRRLAVGQLELAVVWFWSVRYNPEDVAGRGLLTGAAVAIVTGPRRIVPFVISQAFRCSRRRRRRPRRCTGCGNLGGRRGRDLGRGQRERGDREDTLTAAVSATAPPTTATRRLPTGRNLDIHNLSQLGGGRSARAPGSGGTRHSL